MPTIRRATKSGRGEMLEKSPAYRVDFNEAKQLAEMWEIMADLQFVGMATKRLLRLHDCDEMDQVLTPCSWTGPIEAYSRCFSTIPPNKEQVLAGQPGELKNHDNPED